MIDIYNIKMAAGPVLEKKVGADYDQLLRKIFLCFHGQINGNIVVSTLSRLIMNMYKKLNWYFFSRMGYLCSRG